jgi:hypothetical protein
MGEKLLSHSFRGGLDQDRIITAVVQGLSYDLGHLVGISFGQHTYSPDHQSTVFIRLRKAEIGV